MAPSTTGTRKQRTPDNPYHVTHPSFLQADAEEVYGLAEEEPDPVSVTHLVDDVTRDYARRMHYAAYRLEQATTQRERRRWRTAYLDFRDRIVVGNRKLVYRAVHRWSPPPAYAEDLAGDCQVVFIQAVAAYNPWLGIRFSTYAFTCLMRALSRLTQRRASDCLHRSLSLEALPEAAPPDRAAFASSHPTLAFLDQFLRDDHALLSLREKRVLIRRFNLDESSPPGTLEQVGRELGLSKERVRQVQAIALDKLRKALAEGRPSA